jgi:hypothetical protein
VRGVKCQLWHIFLKNPSKIFNMKKIYLSVLAAFCGVMALAQEKSVDVNINTNKGGSNWYASPWVWIVGAAVFILLLVALTRGRDRA